MSNGIEDDYCERRPMVATGRRTAIGLTPEPYVKVKRRVFPDEVGLGQYLVYADESRHDGLLRWTDANDPKAAERVLAHVEECLALPKRIEGEFEEA